VFRELKEGKLQIEPGKEKLLRTREEVRRAWLAVCDTLRRDGHPELAMQIRRYLEQMPRAATEKEYLAARLLARRAREPTTREIEFARWEFLKFKRAARQYGRRLVLSLVAAFPITASGAGNVVIKELVPTDTEFPHIDESIRLASADTRLAFDEWWSTIESFIEYHYHIVIVRREFNVSIQQLLQAEFV
jgi:hypothetical protein